MNSLPFHAKTPSKLSTKERFPRGGLSINQWERNQPTKPRGSEESSSVMKEFLPGAPASPPGFLDIFYHCLPLSENPTAFAGIGTPQLTKMLSLAICDPVGQEIWFL